MKGYINQGRMNSFQPGISKFFGCVKSNFESFTFYTPSNHDPDSIMIMSSYEEGDIAPTFFYMMDGLKLTNF